MLKELSSKQQKVLNYYSDYIRSNGHAPTYREAGESLRLDPSGVLFHVRNLEKMGYLTASGRSVNVFTDKETIPFLGSVACGRPIAIFEEPDEYVEVPKTFLKGGGNFYALRAVGESMKDVGILPGDTLVIRRQDDVDDGDIGVVATGDWADDERATLKRIYHKPEGMILKPANDEFPTTVVKKGMVRGKLVSVIRNY